MSTPSRTTRISFALVLALLLCVALYNALILTGPSWSPSSAFTNNTLNCSWSLSADTIAQNVTVLRNGVTLLSVNETGTSMTLNTSVTIDPANTTKGDTFLCRVILDNSTATAQANTSITILNTPPTTEGSSAGIFVSGTDVGFLINLAEDETVILDVNATDADNDTVTYLLADAFCTRISSTLGTYTCTPVQSDLSSNVAVTQTNITFTVTDGQNVGGRTILFNITPVNDQPEMIVSNQDTPVNVSKNMTFVASDTESNHPLTLQLIAPSEISDKLSLARLNAAGTSLSIYYNAATPDFNDVGVWNVSVNLTDNSTNISGYNDSRSALYNFTFNISAVGRKPYFLLVTPNGTINGSQGVPIQINLTANDSDVNTTIVFSDDTSRFAISTVKSDTNTSAATGQINFTPTNNDVGAYVVTITITDAESLTNTTTLTFNIANVNDAPNVHELSANSSNSGGNINASNLTAYTNTPFTYVVNATDDDIMYGDTLTYTDNTSLFTIGSSTGIINFTPDDGMVGTHTINITVTDNASVNASRVITLTISPNSPPYFNATVPDLNCTTGAACVASLAQYVNDSDFGDNVSNFTLALNATLSALSYNATTGVVNFTPDKPDIGDYLVNLTIRDTFGSPNSTTFVLRINNTPVVPNLTRYDLSTLTIVETHAVSYELRATDEDFLAVGANENITFTTNFSLNHTITPLSTTNSTARATLAFIPADGTAGNYTIAINATDTFGLVSQRNVTFEIFGNVPAPNITQITPWGVDDASHDIQTSYANTSDVQFLDGIADVNGYENTTILFNTTVNSTRPLTYVWTVNGTQVGTSQNYTRAFNFFSSGQYVVRVNVSDDRLESAGFTWNLTVTNVNRAPLLLNNLTTPLSVNGTATYSDYFILGNGTKFIDPDDDLDSSNNINGNESNTLTFAKVQACDVATITTSGNSLTISGSLEGTCVVTFNATDASSATLSSNSVNITIIDVPEGNTPTETITTSSGGGGSSSTFIPISRDETKPEAFNLIAPQLVTVYANQSIDIPIKVNNTWHKPLEYIRVRVETNATNVNATLSSDLIERLDTNESVDLTLTVNGYRFGENYEVRVIANVTDPEFEDTALILLNSIQRASGGDDVDVKVTFANDLINEHPECQELNEVLDRAELALAQNKLDEAESLVDAVINGCKYLVSTSARITEKPGSLNPIISLGDLSVKTVLWSALSFVIILSIALVAYYHRTRTIEDEI